MLRVCHSLRHISVEPKDGVALMVRLPMHNIFGWWRQLIESKFQRIGKLACQFCPNFA